MKWIVSIVVCVFVWAGMEVYRNTMLVRSSYAVQRLQNRIETIEKESGSLKRKISSRLSLTELEDRARNELNLIEPGTVRYMQRESDRDGESSFWTSLWNRAKELLTR